MYDTSVCSELMCHFIRIHPLNVHGRQLSSRTQHGKVEISQITIKSTTYDVTSVYAGRANGKIRIRVVNEYDGDTLVGHPEMEAE